MGKFKEYINEGKTSANDVSIAYKELYDMVSSGESINTDNMVSVTPKKAGTVLSKLKLKLTDKTAVETIETMVSWDIIRQGSDTLKANQKLWINIYRIFGIDSIEDIPKNIEKIFRGAYTAKAFGDNVAWL